MSMTQSMSPSGIQCSPQLAKLSMRFAFNPKPTLHPPRTTTVAHFSFHGHYLRSIEYVWGSFFLDLSFILRLFLAGFALDRYTFYSNTLDQIGLFRKIAWEFRLGSMRTGIALNSFSFLLVFTFERFASFTSCDRIVYTSILSLLFDT